MSESKKQRIEDIEKEQNVCDVQQQSDELAFKQAEQIAYLEEKLKISRGNCKYQRAQAITYKAMVEEMMDAGDYSGPEGDQYAVPSVRQMQGINVSLRHYSEIMRSKDSKVDDTEHLSNKDECVDSHSETG